MVVRVVRGWDVLNRISVMGEAMVGVFELYGRRLRAVNDGGKKGEWVKGAAREKVVLSIVWESKTCSGRCHKTQDTGHRNDSTQGWCRRGSSLDGPAYPTASLTSTSRLLSST